MYTNNITHTHIKHVVINNMFPISFPKAWPRSPQSIRKEVTAPFRHLHRYFSKSHKEQITKQPPQKITKTAKSLKSPYIPLRKESIHPPAPQKNQTNFHKNKPKPKPKKETNPLENPQTKRKATNSSPPGRVVVELTSRQGDGAIRLVAGSANSLMQKSWLSCTGCSLLDLTYQGHEVAKRGDQVDFLLGRPHEWPHGLERD